MGRHFNREHLGLVIGAQLVKSAGILVELQNIVFREQLSAMASYFLTRKLHDVVQVHVLIEVFTENLESASELSYIVRPLKNKEESFQSNTALLHWLNLKKNPLHFSFLARAEAKRQTDHQEKSERAFP